MTRLLGWDRLARLPVVLLTAFAALHAPAEAQPTVTLPSHTVTASAATGELEIGSDLSEAVFADTSTFTSTPRVVSTVSHAVLDQFAVQGIAALGQFVSGVQNTGSYGHNATINVRGDLAETYINGQRRSNNAFGFQPPFNSIDRVDVVHGAAPVVFGPGFYSGGYVNFQTKAATLTPFSEVALTLGSLAPDGNSFVNTSLQLDQNFVLGRSTAARLSYHGVRNETLYRRNGGRDDAQNLFATCSHAWSDRTVLEANVEFSWQSAPQIEGVNRVTQDLIWHDRYLSGPVADPLDASSMPLGPEVTLRATDALISPGDFSNATVLLGQAIITSRISDGLALKHYLLGETVRRRRFNAFEYAEYARQLTADHRTEVHIQRTEAHYTIVGAQLRHERRESHTNYFNAFFNAHDIHAGRRHVARDFAEYLPGTPGFGGQLFFGPSDGNVDTTRSRLASASPFFQQRLHWGDRWQLLYGLRADFYRVRVTDPLAPASAPDGRLSTSSASGTTSLVRSLGGVWSAYITYGHLHAVNGTVSGGGIVFDPDLTINRRNFRSLNRLHEIGLRHQREQATLGLTAFWQFRQQHDFYANNPNDIVVRGVELELKHEPNRTWWWSANVSYTEGNFVNSLPFEFNGIGLPAAAVPGDYRLPGLSRLAGNAVVNRRLGQRFFVAVVSRAQSEQSGNTLGGYHIPAQFSVDLQLGMSGRRWRAALMVHNVTNERNWIHNGDAYGDNVVISRELPARASVSCRYRY